MRMPELCIVRFLEIGVCVMEGNAMEFSPCSWRKYEREKLTVVKPGQLLLTSEELLQ